MPNATPGPDNIAPSRPAPLKPHHGPLILGLGIGSLFIAPYLLGLVTWLLAHRDLKEMDAGHMDPEGRGQTTMGRRCAMASVATWSLLLSCCCCGSVSDQLWHGGRLLSALGSRKITEAEFKKVDHGMTKDQVRSLLGKPARITYEREPGDQLETWNWQEKDGKKTFNVGFRNDGRVGPIGSEWDDD